MILALRAARAACHRPAQLPGGMVFRPAAVTPFSPAAYFQRKRHRHFRDDSLPDNLFQRCRRGRDALSRRRHRRLAAPIEKKCTERPAIAQPLRRRMYASVLCRLGHREMPTGCSLALDDAIDTQADA